MTKIRDTASDYVSNKAFLVEIVKHKLAITNGGDGRVSEELARIFLLIGRRVAHTHPFYSGYPFWLKEEMVSDGVYYCLKYINNFSLDKSENPFAFFTQIMTNAFVQKIMKEYKTSNLIRELKEEEKTTFYSSMNDKKKFYRSYGTAMDEQEKNFMENEKKEQALAKTGEKGKEVLKYIMWENELVCRVLSKEFTSFFKKDKGVEHGNG